MQESPGRKEKGGRFELERQGIILNVLIKDGVKRKDRRGGVIFLSGGTRWGKGSASPNISVSSVEKMSNELGQNQKALRRNV